MIQISRLLVVLGSRSRRLFVSGFKTFRGELFKLNSGDGLLFWQMQLIWHQVTESQDK